MAARKGNVRPLTAAQKRGRAAGKAVKRGASKGGKSGKGGGG